MRTLLFVGLLVVTGCASARPTGEYNYACSNAGAFAPDITVHYTWNPPSARLEQSRRPTIDLHPAPAPDARRGHYAFEGGDGVRLLVTPNHARFERPGAPPVDCEAEQAILL